MATSLLILFILNLGTAFGAGLYEARLIIPQWFPKLEGDERRVDTNAMRQTDVGRNFWAFVTTIPLTLLTVANLIVAWQSELPVHDWWLAASLLTLVERVVTFSFFIPTAIRLQKGDGDSLPLDTTSRLVSVWMYANYGRNALTLLAWALALKALSLV
ncbi:DUF1772 domain-containing protein [Spirosoma gilvum]